MITRSTRSIALAALVLAGCGGTSASLLHEGVQAPDFMAMDQEGEVRSLRLLRHDEPAVLFFYPRDGTPGCTQEACAFRDAWERLQAAGAVVIGVSTDSVEAHARFAQEHHLPFTLLSDPDGNILRSYGVPSRLGMAARVTFIIDREGRIAHVFPDVDPGVHADQVVRALAGL